MLGHTDGPHRDHLSLYALTLVIILQGPAENGEELCLRAHVTQQATRKEDIILPRFATCGADESLLQSCTGLGGQQ